jgi:ABC-2 type transport system ATP-binding protein
MAVVTVKDLSKTYTIRVKKGILTRQTRQIKALDHVSFEIGEGELVGYIGPNGAGKSTTVKILSGILVPDSGECSVRGLCPWKDRARHAARIGVVFGQRSQLWWDLPVIDSFSLLRDIYRIAPGDYRASLDELTDNLDLAPLMNVPVRQLSLGQRMKCELAASLLHRPSLLFLDEPTIGLDASTKIAVRDFIRYINRERGVTVILTTHDMADIEALCSRVMLIGGGKKLLDGDIALLRRGHDERILACDVENAPDNDEEPERVEHMEVDGRHMELRFDPRIITAAELIAEIDSKYHISDLTVKSTPIERVVARVYEEMARQ